MNRNRDGVTPTGAELKSLHDELIANEDATLAEILLLAKCSTSTLYKVYRGEPTVQLKNVNRVANALFSLRDRIRASA